MSKTSIEKHFLALSKDSLTYGLGNIFLKILAVVTIPIITRIFSPADYGIINLVTSIMAFLSLLLIFGMDSALALSFYEYKKEQKQVVSSGFWFLIFWSALLVVIASFFSKLTASVFLKTSIYGNLLVFGYLAAAFTLFTNYCKTVLQLNFKAKIFSLISVINAVLVTGLIIIFIVFLKLGLKGYFVATLLGSVLGFVLSFLFVLKYIVFKVSKNHLWQMISYGALLVPASLATYVFDLSDRYFISRYRDLNELGLYSMAFNITIMISFFAVALSQAWSPFIMNLYFKSKNLYKKFLSKAFIYILILFSILAVVVCLFSHELLLVFSTPKYSNAALAIPSLAITAVFSASVQVTALGISISRKTQYIALITFITALINTALNFLLIPKFGIVGAGWATAISYFFLTATYLLISQKLLYFPVDWSKILRLSLLSGMVIFLSPLILKFGFWQNFILKFAELLVFVFLLYMFKVIEKSEVNYFYTKILRKKAKNGKKPE